MPSPKNKKKMSFPSGSNIAEKRAAEGDKQKGFKKAGKGHDKLK